MHVGEDIGINMVIISIYVYKMHKYDARCILASM